MHSCLVPCSIQDYLLVSFFEGTSNIVHDMSSIILYPFLTQQMAICTSSVSFHDLFAQERRSYENFDDDYSKHFDYEQIQRDWDKREHFKASGSLGDQVLYCI